jgi:hypothetical protein
MRTENPSLQHILLDRLYTADSPDEQPLADWHLGDYLASSGRLMWFAGMVKAAARQHQLTAA